MEEVVKMYEKRLKEINPTIQNITYSVQDLHKYIDHLGDICALVYSEPVKAYIPHDKAWIKQKVLNMLSKAASS